MKRILAVIVVLLASSVVAVAGGGGEPAEADLVIAQSTDSAESPETAETVSDMMEGYMMATVADVTTHWKIEGDMISIQVSSATTGWVAVGFDPSRLMRDANVIIGYVADGEVFLRDDYGISITGHGADVDNGGTYDLSNVEGKEIDGVTTISFTMPLQSGDPLDKPLVAGATHKMIMAHGPDGADGFGIYHGRGNRGSVMIAL